MTRASWTLPERVPPSAAYLLLLCGPVLAVGLLLALPDPDGPHAAGHLGSAALTAGQLGVIAFAARHLRPAIPRTGLLVLVLIAGGLLLQIAGNIVVTRVIWDQPWNDVTAGPLGPGVDGFEQGHRMSEVGDGVVVVGGVLFAVLARGTQPVRLLAGLLAFFPPWLLPGLGVVLLLAHQLAAPRAGAAPSESTVTPDRSGSAGAADAPDRSRR